MSRLLPAVLPRADAAGRSVRRPGGAVKRRLSPPIWAVLALIAISCRETAPPPPPTGSLLYARHCAACHGTGGKGDGPLTATLKRPPSDLTTLAKRHGGAFDEAAVMAVIDGRRSVAEHGPREMPVWGAIFFEQETSSRHGWPEYTALLHGRALVDYVRSLQEP